MRPFNIVLLFPPAAAWFQVQERDLTQKLEFYDLNFEVGHDLFNQAPCKCVIMGQNNKTMEEIERV